MHEQSRQQGSWVMPKMCIGDFYLFYFFDKLVLKELVQQPRLLYFNPLPTISPCSLQRMNDTAAHLYLQCTVWKIRADLCENTFVCFVDWKDILELQFMKSLWSIWSLTYFYKWNNRNNGGKIDKKDQKMETDGKEWPSLVLAQVECKIISAFIV